MSLFCLIFQTDTILYLTVSKAELPDVPLERLKASNVCMSVCLYVDLRMCAMYVHLLQKENTVDSIKSIESFMVLDFLAELKFIIFLVFHGTISIYSMTFVRCICARVYLNVKIYNSLHQAAGRMI